MHSVWFRSTFLRVLKFLEIKECGPNFWREAILQKVWIIWSSFLYFNFKSFMDPNSLSLITFSMHSAWFGSTFLRDLKFLQIKGGRGNFLGESICRKSEWFVPPFCISILKVLWSQILCHSLDFNAFCMVQEYFSESLEISTN